MGANLRNLAVQRCGYTIGREPPVSRLLAAVAFGTSDRARTYDPRIKNPLLYQLSYGGRLWGGEASDLFGAMQASFNCPLSLLDAGLGRRQTPRPVTPSLLGRCARWL